MKTNRRGFLRAIAGGAAAAAIGNTIAPAAKPTVTVRQETFSEFRARKLKALEKALPEYARYKDLAQFQGSMNAALTTRAETMVLGGVPIVTSDAAWLRPGEMLFFNTQALFFDRKGVWRVDPRGAVLITNVKPPEGY